MHFYCKRTLLVASNWDRVGLRGWGVNRSSCGSEDVKRTGVEKLTGVQPLNPLPSTHSLFVSQITSD